MTHLMSSNVLLRVFYWRPDHPLLLQTFVHQFDDIVPTIPRTHDFLNFWKRNIIAPINAVEVDIGDGILRPVVVRHTPFQGLLQ